MVEVVRETFKDVYVDIENAVRNCDFIAVDSEFTGLRLGESTKSSLFDDASERYKKLRKVVTQITMCQLGLSIFTKDHEENRYVAKTYNFYLCPRPFGPIDPLFVCQASSLEFLCRYNFDFNKFIYQGISYMNELDLQTVQEHIASRAMFAGLEREVDEAAMQNVCSSVADWLINHNEGSKMSVTKEGMYNIRPYILSMELRARFPGIWTSIDKETQSIEVEKISSEKRLSLESEDESRKKDYEQETIDTLLGFTKVVRVMTEAQKPLVGHNMLMDLMLLYDKCYQPLPSNYQDFKANLNHIFLCIYDTKHMVLCLRQNNDAPDLLQQTSLSQLYTSLSSPAGRDLVIYSPEVQHAEGFTKYKMDNLPHEAGFDAYMCGFVFLRTLHYITFKDTKSSQVVPCPFRRYLHSSTAFVNRINLIRANVNYLSLAGPEPVSRRPEMLIVRRRLLKQKLDLDQLGKWFSPYGSVDIRTFGTTQALVATGNYRCAKDILKAFKHNDAIYVTKYNRWRHSPVFKSLLWSGVLVSSGLCVWALLSSNKKS